MNKENKLYEKNILHVSFEIALILKGINGVFETIGGILFLFLTPDRVNNESIGKVV